MVRIIFDKYVHEGFGAQRIATYLNNLGYRDYRLHIDFNIDFEQFSVGLDTSAIAA